jgi:hypothetical protein
MTPPVALTAVAGVRLLTAAAIAAAVIATHLEAASRVVVNPFNLYGYFTVQSNLIAAAALVLTALTGVDRRRVSTGLGTLRALAVTCLVIVGLVYATLLAPLGAAGGVPLPWANAVLHVVTPLVAIADWLIVGDRPALARGQLWPILAYPAVWLSVVLVRGATDGWVPYPFLDPAQGYPTVALYCLVILLVFIGVGLAVLRGSRTRGVLLAAT